jgi:lipopolysaccharide/colanic/teichoic acid biosynthesis glycosyltransferase
VTPDVFDSFTVEGVGKTRMQMVLTSPSPTRIAKPSIRMMPVYVHSAVMPSAAYVAAKRALDVVVSATMLVFLSPLFLILTLLIKLTDGGPVFFRQKRVGENGFAFDFVKFRSMCVNAEALKPELIKQNKHANSITFKMCRDPRVTWIGRILRKTSLDELPQLWNVLKGEMTLVGPRPAVIPEVMKYTVQERRRLGAVPGLTCIWQVSGRADLDFQQQVALDIRYIRERSLWMDFKLLVMTVPAVLSGKGAY